MDSGEHEYSHACQLITSAGAHTVVSPAAGKRLRIRWVYALNDPVSDSPAAISIDLGAENLFCTFGVSKRQKKTGGIDEDLVVTTDTNSRVAVTIVYEEIDP